MVEVVEARACPAPSLLSPPVQPGDALFSGSHNSHEQNKFEEPGGGLSNSLPSFNILKSYDSSSLQESIVCEPRPGQGGSEAINEDRFSPYESHSDPSLSPPLTPPIQEFQVFFSQCQHFVNIIMCRLESRWVIPTLTTRPITRMLLSITPPLQPSPSAAALIATITGG